MNITKIHTLYFSATGTTAQVVKALANHLAAGLNVPVEHHDFTLPGGRAQRQHFDRDELLILGVPVYAGRVPNVLLPYLNEKLFGNSTPAIPVVLYGNRAYDEALKELCCILRTNGCTPLAGAAMIGEHSFSQTLGAGRPDTADMEVLARFSTQVLGKLRAQIPTPLSLGVGDPVQPYYKPIGKDGKPSNILKVKPETLLENCVKCGLCSQLCPMGSINPENPSEVTGICIKCCACIKHCPKQAKVFTDENFLFHKQSLEETFTRRALPEFFL